MYRITGSSGLVRTVDAASVRRELVVRHGEDVLADLLSREMVELAVQESELELDVEELEQRWFRWTQEPELRARLDRGEVSEREIRSKLESLVLLDQLTLYQYNPEEQDELLKEFYQRHRWELEEVKVRHILLDSEKSARDVAERLSAGVDFAALAQRFSLDPLTRDQGGDLGWRRRQDWSEELRPLIFLIPPGRVTNPVSTKHGWHLFLVEEKRSEFDELRPVVKREWCKRRRTETMTRLKERFQVKSLKREEIFRQLPSVIDRWRFPISPE